MCSLEKRGNVYILTLTGDDDHRLNPTRLESIRAALRRVSSSGSGSASALITAAEGKFFSNGYDLEWAKSDAQRFLLMSQTLRSLIADLISLPMPTIAAVTGHASAAGFILSLAHDYVLMRRDRGFLYMSEMDINLVVPPWMVTVLKSKIRLPLAIRDMVMRAAKLTADKAVEQGIIDSAHDSAEDTLAAAVKLGEELARQKWEGTVYSDNRKVLFADVLLAVTSSQTEADVVAANVLSRL